MIALTGTESSYTEARIRETEIRDRVNGCEDVERAPVIDYVNTHAGLGRTLVVAAGAALISIGVLIAAVL